MTRDRVYDYFINKDFNCAESILHALDDQYRLGISPDGYKLVGGFGGGMGCGKACGALCGGCSGLSYLLIQERAHATPELKERVAEFAQRFVEAFGSDACEELAKTYKKEDTRCLELICMAADIADACFGKVKQGDDV